jgi:hypothetical protein
MCSRETCLQSQLQHGPVCSSGFHTALADANRPSLALFNVGYYCIPSIYLVSPFCNAHRCHWPYLNRPTNKQWLGQVSIINRTIMLSGSSNTISYPTVYAAFDVLWIIPPLCFSNFGHSVDMWLAFDSFLQPCSPLV